MYVCCAKRATNTLRLFFLLIILLFVETAQIRARRERRGFPDVPHAVKCRDANSSRSSEHSDRSAELPVKQDVDNVL